MATCGRCHKEVDDIAAVSGNCPGCGTQCDLCEPCSKMTSLWRCNGDGCGPPRRVTRAAKKQATKKTVSVSPHTAQNQATIGAWTVIASIGFEWDSDALCWIVPPTQTHPDPLPSKYLITSNAWDGVDAESDSGRVELITK